MSRTTTITTKSSKMRLPTASSFLPKNPWPDPQGSIGDALCSLGRSRCWEAKGPAGDISRGPIFREIKVLLESRHEYLNEGESVYSHLSYAVYMIGRSEKHARPTIVFSCVRQPPRQRALKLVRESRILDDHPAILLGECSRPPILSRPPRLLFDQNDGEGGDEVMFDSIAGERYLPGLIYYDPPAKDIFGIPIFIRREGHASEVPTRRATIGGLFMLEDQLVGLTVKHVFVDVAPQMPTHDDTNMEFSLEDDGETSEEEDDNFVQMTSRGSVSPHMADSIESGSSGRMGPLPTLDEDRPSRQPEMKSQGHSQKPPLSSPSQPQQAILGHLLASNSVQNVSGGHFYLDWALVHVDALNFKQSGNGTARFPSFAAINLDELAKSTDNKPDQRPATANVLVATGSNGILKGTLSSNITYMGLDPKNEVFQEVWTVHLNGPLAPGDCGSWVVDGGNGYFYGHIVAGDPGASVAYITPAYQIFEDIGRLFLGKPTFLSENTCGWVFSEVSSSAKDNFHVEVDRSKIGTYEDFLLKSASKEIKLEDPDDGPSYLLPALPRPVHTFGNRDSELEKIHKALSRRAVCCLTGAKGAGKSELALEYAYRYGDYAEIFWITNTSSTSSYAFMKPLDDKKPNLSQHLGDEEKKGRLAILLDAESGPIIDILLHKWDLDRTSVLITTQDSEFSPSPGVFWYRMEVLKLSVDRVTLVKQEEAFTHESEKPDIQPYISRVEDLKQVRTQESSPDGGSGIFQSSIHGKYRSRNAQAYDKSLLQKLDARKTTDRTQESSPDGESGIFQSSVHGIYGSSAQAYDKSLLQKLDARKTTDNTPARTYGNPVIGPSANDSFTNSPTPLSHQYRYTTQLATLMPYSGQTLTSIPTRAESPLAASTNLSTKDIYLNDEASQQDEYPAAKRIRREATSPTMANIPQDDKLLRQLPIDDSNSYPATSISNIINAYALHSNPTNSKIDNKSLPDKSSSEEKASPPKPVGRKRTKTGCLTCRKRRIKCGEERPTCHNCQKSKRQCEGYNQRVVFKDPLEAYSIVQIAPRPQSDTRLFLKANDSSTRGMTIYEHPLEPIVRSNERLYAAESATQPMKAETSANLLTREYDLFDDEFYDNSDEEEHASSTVQEVIPAVISNIIVAANIDDHSRRSFTAMFSIPVGTLTNYTPSSQQSPLHSTTAARIFCHFINVVASTISIYERRPANPAIIFTGDPVPPSQQHIWTYTMPVLALGNQALLHSVLSLSSLQIASFQGESSMASLKHYHIAIRRVGKSVSLPTRRRKPETLAAVLLLGWYEAMSANYEKWNHHLKGASNLLKEIDFAIMARYSSTMVAQQVSDESIISRTELGFLDGIDDKILRILDGNNLRYDDSDKFWKEPAAAIPLPQRYTQRDLDTYESQRDLFWWFCKQDVMQSILSGNDLHWSFDKWRDVRPRAPIGQLNALCGTHDHLILLLGRVAAFAAKDLQRKLRALQRNGGQWRPPGNTAREVRAESSSAGDRRLHSKTIPASSLPTVIGLMPNFTANLEECQSSPENGSELSLNEETLQAQKEWKDIMAAFYIFEARLDETFQPLGPEFSQPIRTPFGSAKQYRTYSIACIWMSFNMGLIVLRRVHPTMPPTAILAAGAASRHTAQNVNEIGNIAAGLAPDAPILQSVNPVIAGSLIESSFALFIAGVQYLNAAQRIWTIQRFSDIRRLTGWQSTFASGCESAWIKTAELGLGPPYTRTAETESAVMKQEPIGVRETQASSSQDNPERRLVISGNSTKVDRVHYALGLLGVEEDFEDLEFGGTS